LNVEKRQGNEYHIWQTAIQNNFDTERGKINFIAREQLKKLMP
jgi:hypothetical protein